MSTKHYTLVKLDSENRIIGNEGHFKTARAARVYAEENGIKKYDTEKEGKSC